MNTSLVVLVCLHAYWLSLIIQIVIAAVRGKTVTDIRDEQQDEKPNEQQQHESEHSSSSLQGEKSVKLANGNGHANGVH